jgi:hypothetical protein
MLVPDDEVAVERAVEVEKMMTFEKKARQYE